MEIKKKYNKKEVYLLLIILLISINNSLQENIIPDPINPIFVNIPTNAYSGQTLTITFQLAENSVGLTYYQVLGVIFPASRGGTDYDYSSINFSCSLRSDTYSFQIEPVASIESTINGNTVVPIDKNIAYCRYLDSTNLIPITTYYLSLTFTNKISITNYLNSVGLLTASDNNTEKIIFDYNPNIGTLGLYSDYINYSGSKALKISSTSVLVTSGPSSTSGLSTIYPNNTFDISFKIRSEIYISKEDFFILMKYSNSRFTAPTGIEALPSISGNSLTETLSGSFSVSDFEINTNEDTSSLSSIIIKGNEEDLVPNREFIFNLKGWTSKNKFLNTSSKLSLWVYYKNSYSVVSYSEIDAPIVKYNLITGSVNHPEYFKLFDGMGWPLKFTFSVNNDISEETFIIIRQSNTIDVGDTLTPPRRWTFVAASCDFSEDTTIDNTFGNRPFCQPLRNDFKYSNLGSSTAYEGDGIVYKMQNGLVSGTNYVLTVWGFAEICGTSLDATSSIDTSFRSYFAFNIKLYKQIDVTLTNEDRFVIADNLVGQNNNSIQMSQECIHTAELGTSGFETNFIDPTAEGTIYATETTDFWTMSVPATIPTTFPATPTNILQYFGQDFSYQTQGNNKYLPNTNITEKFMFSSNTPSLVANNHVLIGKYTRTSDSAGSREIAKYMPTDCYYDTGSSTWKNTPSRWEFIFSKAWFDAGQNYATTGCMISITHEIDFTTSETVCQTTDYNCFQRPVYNNGDTGVVNYIKSGNPTGFANTIDTVRTHLPPNITSTTGTNSLYRISSVKDDATGDTRDKFGVVENCSDTTTLNATTNTDIGYFETIIFTNCLKWKATAPAIKSMYSYLDIQWHNVRQFGASSVNSDPITRIWRYIKLFPEPGVFQDYLTDKYESTRRLIVGHYTLTFYNKRPFAICLIEIDGQSLSEAFDSSTSNTLVVWLFSTSLLDIDLNENAADYPIAPVTSDIIAYGLNSGQTISSYNKLSTNNTTTSFASPNTMLEKRWFGTNGNYFSSSATTAPYDTRKTMYQFYLGSVIYIRFKSSATPSNLITSSTVGNYPNLFIPFYCPQFNNINSNKGTNGVAFAHPVVMVSWINTSSWDNVAGISKMLIDTTQNSMNIFTNTPSATVFNTSTRYARTMIGLYKGGSGTLASNNVTQNPFAISPQDNLKNCVLRFNAYEPSTLSNNELFLYNTTLYTTNSGIIKCSGMSFILNKEVEVDSSNQITVSGFAGFNKLYAYTASTDFIVNGIMFNKVVLGSIPHTNNSSATPPTYTAASPYTIPNSGTTNINPTSNFRFYGIIRPNLTTVSKIDLSKSGTNKHYLDATDKIGFFCVNNLLIENPATVKNNIIVLSNFYFENTETSTSLKHFLLDFNPYTTLWPSVTITTDSEEVYKEDVAGNILIKFTPPGEVPSGATIELEAESGLFNTDTLCGLMETSGEIVTNCLVAGVNLSCPITINASQFNICCYNVEFFADVVEFSNAYIGVSQIPDITNAFRYLSSSYFNTITSIASQFEFDTNQSTAKDPIFSSAVHISSFTYLHTQQNNSIGIAQFKITFGRNPSKHMQVVLEGDISSFLVPDNYPRCRASFEFDTSKNTNDLAYSKNYEKGDVMLQTCAVNSLSDSTQALVILTRNIVYKCGLSMNRTLTVRLWPVIEPNWAVKPYSELTFRFLSKLINSKKQLSSTSTSFNMPFDISNFLDSPAVNNVWGSLCPITKIWPSIVGEYADYTFKFDLLAYQAQLQAVNAAPNELSIIFPFKYFNEYIDNVYCYYNSSTVNCTYTYANILNIRFNDALPLGIINITVTGIKNPEIESAISIPCTVNETNFSTSERKSIAVGSGSLSALTDSYTSRGEIRYLNEFEELSTTTPRYRSKHYFKFTVDFSNDITTDISIGYNPIISVTFPQNYNMPWYSTEEISASVSEFRVNTTATKGTIPILETIREIEKTVVIGNRVDIYYKDLTGMLVSPIQFKSSTFLYFLVSIAGITNPTDNIKTTESFEILMLSSDNTTLLKTDTNMNNWSYTLLSPAYNEFLKYYRGYEFEFPDTIWVIDVIDKEYNTEIGKDLINYIRVRPGRYLSYNFKVKDNSSQLIFLRNTFITLSSNIFSLFNNEYEVQTGYFQDIPFQLGSGCDTAPGSYLIKFDSSDTTSVFAPLAPVQVKVDNSTKGVISYISPSSVRVAGSTFIYYQLSEPNFDEMTIKWTKISAELTSSISEETIKPALGSNLFATFSITANYAGFVNFSTISPSDCYKWAVDEIQITVTGSISIIPNNSITIDNFTYYNSETDPSLEKNSIKFVFSTQYTDLYLFCALVCYNKEFPLNELIKNPDLTYPSAETYLLRFKQFNIVSAGNTDIKFTGLLRGQRYKLKCIAESSNGDQTDRTISTIEAVVATRSSFYPDKEYIYSDIKESIDEKLWFLPTKPHTSECVSYTFDSDPGTTVKEAIINRCQKAFSEGVGFNDNGCVVCADIEGDTMNGFNLPTNSTCYGNTYKFHAPTADSDPLLSLVGSFEVFTVCAVPHPVCETDVIDNEFLKTFSDFYTELSSPSNFRDVLNITGIRAFEQNPYSDSESPNLEKFTLAGISVDSGIFKFNLTNIDPIACYMRMSSNSTLPDGDSIEFCTSLACDYVIVNEYNSTGSVDLSPILNTTTFYLYALCYNDVPYPQYKSEVVKLGSKLVEVDPTVDPGFNSTDSIDIGDNSVTIKFDIWHLALLLIYLI